MIPRFYNAAAGCTARRSSAKPCAGEFACGKLHLLHAIVMEGGFDPAGRFVHIPRTDLTRLSQYFRAPMVRFFLGRELINQRLAS